MAIKAEHEMIGSEAELAVFEARHLPGALKLSQEMRWPYRLEDWQFAAAAGKGLVLERDGEVIGTAMWWTYGQTHASAGMIIVTAAEQGRGYGARLFDSLLEATEGRVVLLCSTEEGMPLYKNRGFVELGTVVQHQGVLATAVSRGGNHDIRPATVSDAVAIQALDRRATGLDRAQLVASLAEAGRALLIERSGRVAGYAVARRFGRGLVVGPVAAENTDDAKALILAQLSDVQGQFVRIDVHAEQGLSDWLESLGLERVNQVTAMVKGQPPVFDAQIKMYALANQSFG